MTQHRGAGETQQESSNIPSSAPILEDYNPQSEERKVLIQRTTSNDLLGIRLNELRNAVWVSRAGSFGTSVLLG